MPKLSSPPRRIESLSLFPADPRAAREAQSIRWLPKTNLSRSRDSVKPFSSSSSSSGEPRLRAIVLDFASSLHGGGGEGESRDSNSAHSWNHRRRFGGRRRRRWNQTEKSAAPRRAAPLRSAPRRAVPHRTAPLAFLAASPKSSLSPPRRSIDPLAAETNLSRSRESVKPFSSSSSSSGEPRLRFSRLLSTVEEERERAEIPIRRTLGTIDAALAEDDAADGTKPKKAPPRFFLLFPFLSS